MNVFLPGSRGLHRLYEMPGKVHPETSDFLGPDGKPVLMTIEFRDGVAEVPDNLGRFLIDAGCAKASPILLLDIPSLLAA